MRARVLIVDDDPATRRILDSAIKDLDLGCHFCSDGVHALDALQCNRDFVLLLADISMKVMDGRSLIEIIRRDKRLPDIPIIIMSGVVTNDEVSDLLERGASKFLPKPFGLDDIREAVRNCLDLETPVS